MGKIVVLPTEIARKIAAGEVVEKPLSVVKELVENSLDANSDFIEVEIEEGGKKKIVVKDNGDGILKEDLPIIFKRHSTSKIKTVDDLENIITYGFRGEALSSIAEISKTTIITATSSDEVSSKISFFNGELSEIESDTYRKGTTVIVENLFYNLPARKNFLRTNQTEALAIKRFLRDFSLANEKVSIKLISDGKEVFFYEAVSSKSDRFYQVFGKEKFYEDFMEIEGDGVDYRLYGFFVKPGLTEYKKYPQLTFVNGRFVKEKVTVQAIYQAYDTYLQKGIKPGFIIFINVPPSDLEVNIHPTKAEVKYKHSSDMFRFIRNSVRRGLENFYLEREIPDDSDSSDFQDYSSTFSKSSSSRFVKDTSSSAKNGSHELFPRDFINREERIPFMETEEKAHNFRVIGQYLDSYVIVEKDGKLLIIDQHNADERIRYERLLEKTEETTKSIAPIFPLIFEIRPDDDFEDKIKRLQELGWEIELWGEKSIHIKKYPAIMHSENIREFVFEYFEKGKESNPEDDILKLMACKSAIKVNHKLNYEEMVQLVSDLFKTKNPYLCPHSRPIIVEITEDFIKRELKRK